MHPAKKLILIVALKVLLLAAIGFAVINTVLAEVRTSVPTSQQEIRLSYAPLVKKAAPAVVNIFTKTKVKQSTQPNLFNDPFYEQFFGRSAKTPKNKKKTQNSLGSGVLVSADGIVITNYHVVKGADEITVALNDRREFSAKAILEDEKTDLAVLKIEGNGEIFPFLTFENSDKLEVGDLVLAIGNPFGVGQTVTSGIISALGRTTGAASEIESFIQTDAAINPGNSGGALLTMNGTLAGINSAIFSKGGGSLGIGFAIPSNLVQSVLQNGLATGRVIRPWLGVNGQTVGQELATSLGMVRPQGVVVSDIYPGSAADQAGLNVNDVILEVNGYEIINGPALTFRISTGRLGDKSEMTLWRNDERLTVQVPMIAAPETPDRDLVVLMGKQPLNGATVGNLSPAFALELEIFPFTRGVVISAIQQNSFASGQGFRARDVITEINGVKVTATAQLQSLLKDAKGDWNINLLRNGRPAFLRLKR
jgi:Do/DeqQ family serine protease